MCLARRPPLLLLQRPHRPLSPGEPVEEIVTDLPGRGDHQLSPPTFGPDGKLYFSTGSATNCGVVGADNIAYEWLRNPALHDVCDIPGTDVVLTGRNYESQDVTGKLRDKVCTGAFVPFGTETEAGQVIPGRTKCTTGVLRCDPDGSNVELLAWGLRNAFGLQHHPDGRLFATEHGIDERSARFIVGDPDDFYEVTPGPGTATPTSILPHNGFERPVDCRFGPHGSLYVVDWARWCPHRSEVVWRFAWARACGGVSGGRRQITVSCRPSLWSCR